MNTLRKIALLWIVTALEFGLSGAGKTHAQEGTSNPPENSQKYVGPEVCQGCHESAYDTFNNSAHKALLKSKDVGDLGCEACHGPGYEHVEAGDPAKVWRYSAMRPETIASKCTRCHEAELGKAHTKAHLTCLTCHSIHHPSQRVSLLIKPAAELCRRCHK